tara:strand:+ start:451 stop:663 length:213 start_codon:yes stop_codon:yes gene_type:complete
MNENRIPKRLEVFREMRNHFYWSAGDEFSEDPESPAGQDYQAWVEFIDEEIAFLESTAWYQLELRRSQPE